MAVSKPRKRATPKPDESSGTDGLCKVSRAAAFLDVTIRMVFILIERGELESVKVGRARRIKWSSLRQYAGCD